MEVCRRFKLCSVSTKTHNDVGGISSVVERPLCMREASGSNPEFSMSPFYYFKYVVRWEASFATLNTGVKDYSKCQNKKR